MAPKFNSLLPESLRSRPNINRKVCFLHLRSSSYEVISGHCSLLKLCRDPPVIVGGVGEDAYYFLWVRMAEKDRFADAALTFWKTESISWFPISHLNLNPASFEALALCIALELPSTILAMASVFHKVWNRIPHPKNSQSQLHSREPGGPEVLGCNVIRKTFLSRDSFSHTR